MALVCWLALLTPGVAPPAGVRLFDDPSLPYPLDALTREGGGGYDGCRDEENEEELEPPEATPGSLMFGVGVSADSGLTGRLADTRYRFTFASELRWVGLRPTGVGLFIRPADAELGKARKRAFAILASDRLEHHKREEIARLIRLGMTQRQVSHLLGQRASNALVLIEATLYFDLDLVVEHPSGTVTRVKARSWDLHLLGDHSNFGLEFGPM